MSLYLGNLSSRTRRDDLERVFRRFGRNSIQIKDGYGFVVYDIPEDANRALRTLQGKNICGEKISISWSNIQPKPYRRFTRGSRLAEPYRGRNFVRREDFGSRVGASHHEGRFKSVTGEVDAEDVGRNMDDNLEKETANSCDAVAENEGDKFENVDESLMVDELPVGSMLEDTGRWGEPVSDSSDRREADNGQGIELYEPYHGHARIDEGENRYRPTPHGSFARGSSREKSQKYHIVETSTQVTDLKDQLKCHICGLIGHLKRHCPQQDGFHQEKFARLDRWRDRDVSFRDKRGLKRARPVSGGQPNLTIKCPPRRSKMDVSSLASRKLPRYVRDKTSLSAKTRESQRKKNRKRENGNPVKEGRKDGREGSSPRHSDSTASWLRSTSSGTRSYSSSGSRSRSRLSSRTHSASSSSRSVTPSSKSRSESFRSRSRSASPASFSLSVSLSQPSRSAHNKVDVEDTGTSPKNYLEEDNKSASDQISIDQRQKKGDDANTEKSKLNNTNEDPLNENRSLSIKVNDDMNTNHYCQSSENRHHKLDETGHAVKGRCLDPSNGGLVSIDRLSSESSGERKGTQNSGLSKLEDTQVSCEKQNSEVPSTVRSKNSTNISLQEMHMVLKHYGLEILNENEENLSVEEYFGSARLWPWEVIYYRRLKKGPISTENYARRIAQNEEFGIVDKYIRSSSGWGECEQSSW